LKKLDKLQKQLEAIQFELEDLEKFHDTQSLRRFKRLLHGELSTVKEQIKKSTETRKDREVRHLELIEKAKNSLESDYPVLCKLLCEITIIFTIISDLFLVSRIVIF